MKKTEKQMKAELFAVYQEQCSDVKINYERYDLTTTSAHIGLNKDWIEIVHFTNYQGGYAIKFSGVRGDSEYFFDTYLDAVKYLNIPEADFDEYVLSITL
jgi:hypothetical protein